MLHEPDLRYRQTLDCLLEGFQIIGPDWRYVYVNPAAAAHGRRAPDELIGSLMWEVYPSIRETPLFALLARCMAERTDASLENRFTFPDGTERWFELRVQPVPEGVCVLSVDIEDRKAIEARLREQAALATLGELAAVLAHELKNPLAGVRGAIQVIGRKLPADTPERAVIGEIITRLDGLNALLTELLLFARPPTLRRAPIELTGLLRTTADILMQDPGLRSAEVTIEGDAPPIAADGELLKSVFVNLLLNAAQAMNGRGKIRVAVRHAGRRCEVAITDAGPGIPRDVRDKIFTPFFTTKSRGTGLGLPTARRLVEAHGGEVSVDCPAEGGTVVTVHLPLDENAQHQAGR
ncbi:MAG: two-component system sensor histidine kinase NtrB [Betaproteobacteria bacterium]